MANPETLNNSNEDLIQESLNELKEQIKPGIVKFENESKDKKYNIYSYTLVQGGTRGGIKNKYINQIGPWVEGTQFTDVNGHEIKKDKFDAGEKVYLRVPKKENNNEQKESKKIPGKVENLGNKTDKESRNWKFYSYTFSQGGTIPGVMDKFKSQLGKDTRYERYCDENGKNLRKEWFNKGETIYYKEPNTDIIDSTPEMTISEIMKLSDNDVKHIFDYFSGENKSYIEHQDKKGYFIKIHGKKLYSYFGGINIPDNKPFINHDAAESATNIYRISLGIKKGNNIQGITFDGEDDPQRGTIPCKDAFERGLHN